MTEEEIKEKRKKMHGEIVQLPVCPKCNHATLIEWPDREFCLRRECGYENKHIESKI
jgi:hypothetical protein